VKTGASVPSYSGGVAAGWWIRNRVLRDVARAPMFHLLQRPPYAVFLQNTPILSHAVPRAMPWAGMHCPLRGKLNDDGFRCARFVALAVPVGAGKA
jgi:hypothetical protein